MSDIRANEIRMRAELRNYRILDLGEYKMAIGQIYNDARNRFDDGATIRTSFIIDMNEEEGWIETVNTIYWIT